ncbi:hypothetical protein [Aliiroseovarius sp. 2305UL8-7]|uniref:hypothetical protein n=1 Tax=Aliiroseovarius conchicola TaxID=3121637 RepID=UPI003528EB27
MPFSNSVVVAALCQLKKNWRQAVILAALPFLVTLLDDVLFWSYTWAWGEEQSSLGEPFIMGIIGVVAILFVLTLMAIGWHRLVIQQETPSLSGLTRPFGRVFTYLFDWLILGFLISIASFVVLMPFLLWSVESAMPYDTTILLGETLAMIVVPYVIAGTLVLRLGLGLVATATGRPKITFVNSWRMTRAHSRDTLIAGLWLGVLGLLVFLPTEIMQSNRGAAIAYDANMTVFDGFSSVLYAAGTVVLALMEIAMLTELYGRVFNDQQGTPDQL